MLHQREGFDGDQGGYIVSKYLLTNYYQKKVKDTGKKLNISEIPPDLIL